MNSRGEGICLITSKASSCVEGSDYHDNPECGYQEDCTPLFSAAPAFAERAPRNGRETAIARFLSPHQPIRGSPTTLRRPVGDPRLGHAQDRPFSRPAQSDRGPSASPLTRRSTPLDGDEAQTRGHPTVLGSLSPREGKTKPGWRKRRWCWRFLVSSASACAERTHKGSGYPSI